MAEQFAGGFQPRFLADGKQVRPFQVRRLHDEQVYLARLRRGVDDAQVFRWQQSQAKEINGACALIGLRGLQKLFAEEGGIHPVDVRPHGPPQSSLPIKILPGTPVGNQFRAIHQILVKKVGQPRSQPKRLGLVRVVPTQVTRHLLKPSLAKTGLHCAQQPPRERFPLPPVRADTKALVDELFRAGKLNTRADAAFPRQPPREPSLHPEALHHNRLSDKRISIHPVQHFRQGIRKDF